MNRKGDWIQIFMFMFFFLLLLIALSLLFVEKDRIQSERPETAADLLYQKSDVMLTNFLRQPVELDVNGDGTAEETTVAVLIALNEDGAHDDMLVDLVEGLALPGRSVRLEVAYPGRTFTHETLASPRDLLDNRVLTELQLQGARITFSYADPQTRAHREELRNNARSVTSGGAR